jgi:hypothetical protein
MKQTPKRPENTIMGSLQGLKEKEIFTPSRGLWILEKFAKQEAIETSQAAAQEGSGAPTEIHESAYYDAFADWLVGQDEVIEAMVVGWNSFKNKWATPDVIGTYKPKPSDHVKFPLELISAEIKIDGSQSIVAFGQACAYRLCSHKTYIVMLL